MRFSDDPFHAFPIQDLSIRRHWDVGQFLKQPVKRSGIIICRAAHQPSKKIGCLKRREFIIASEHRLGRSDGLALSIHMLAY